jgi:hypothetical protein
VGSNPTPSATKRNAALELEGLGERLRGSWCKASEAAHPTQVAAPPMSESMCNGTQTSAFPAGANSKSRGSTPTIVTLLLSSWIPRPATCGSPPN